MQRTDERMALRGTIHLYERLAAVVAVNVSDEGHNVRIDWAYPDGTWAGVTMLDKPLTKADQTLRVLLQQERTHLVTMQTITVEVSADLESIR